ncbi:MAG TPA: EVE domain-containing protein, partial [Pseudidiomarina sp.]|nr:EVE domain-containing protein [Pseudidiomarina sp.]
MNYWLMKTEPDELGIDDFAQAPSRDFMWDGVRNYQARNFMREMQVGDHVVLYHSSCRQIGAAGIVEVSRAAYPDPEQFNPESPYYDPKSTPDNPRWDAVDLRFIEHFSSI